MNGKLYKVVVGNKIINNFDDALHVFSPVNQDLTERRWKGKLTQS